MSDGMAAAKREGRHYDTGAYRDGADGKLSYYRALCPVVLTRYVQYLDETRLQSNGEMRDFDNWKQGIPLHDYADSFFRHAMQDLWPMLEERREYTTKELQDTLCAVLFNCQGMLHEILKNQQNPTRAV